MISMQNIEQVAIEASAKNSVNTIQTGDQLVILITAKDMDVVRPFNQNYSSLK
jgi:polysaccharide export outer membrane protein